MIKAPVYNPQKDGNVFRWLLVASQVYRKRKQVETNAAKEATTELKRMGPAEVEDQKW